jgi:hypothetical protein
VFVAGWQALTVHYSYGGNWTALYCTGALFKPIPADLQSEDIYVFPNSSGYDGQIYHYLAHDPWFRRNYAAAMDEPRYRGRRILVPGLAYLLAFGRSSLIDRAYLAVVWLFTALGGYWLSRFAQTRGYPAWLGLGFALVPAVLVSMDRLTVDVALAACCVGFALYSAEEAPAKLYTVLALAGLSRETGLLLPAAYCIFIAGERYWRKMLIFATSVLPVAAWYLYLDFHTLPEKSTHVSFIPLLGAVSRILHPFPYPFGGIVRTTAITLDFLALAGILAGLAWAVWRAFHRAWNPVTVAIYLFALLAMVLTQGDGWSEVYAFGRTLTPLLLLAALDGLEIRSILPGLGMLLIDPRIGLQLGSQILNVVRLSPADHVW